MFLSTWVRKVQLHGRSRTHRSPDRRFIPQVKSLESRDLPSTIMQPTYVASLAKPLATSGPTGTTPAQIRQAYGFNQISFLTSNYNNAGAGETIAIVDAYDDPNIASDLHQFDVAEGLPDPPSFVKVNQSGGTTMPSGNSGWATEISLDVEWAHAMAPSANILLVEANSASDTNLFAAVRYAADQPGVVAVSMSWGGGESSSETADDASLTTPSGHTGVTFIASSGDEGAPASYPATSPNVLAVGGTTLNLTSQGNISSESAWSGSGGGISTVESQPSYQKGVVTQSTTMRTNPDVSYDANPSTGFSIYDTYGTSSAWAQYGGTSDAAPQWAALIAIADQGRALVGETPLDGASQTLPMLYKLPGDFHDITTGSSTGSPSYAAGTGYDLTTGLGTPMANLLVRDLAGQSSSPSPPAQNVVTHLSITATPTSVTAGSSFNLTVNALNASNQLVPGYTGTIHFTSTDAAAVLPANYTFTSGGSYTFSVVLKTAGSQQITVTDTGNSALTASSSVLVTPGHATHLVFGQEPTSTSIGGTISPAVTVMIEDQYNNVLTTDTTDQVTVAIGTNPGSATLKGTTTVTVSNGVATFNNLSIGTAGNGYTLMANGAGMTTPASTSFNVSSSTLIDGFESSETWNVVGGRLTASLSTSAAHDGTYGLDMSNGSDWIYRSDAAAQVKQGDTVSVWLRLAGAADGRAYFGFGATAAGTLSLVVAPNTGQLILQQNTNYGFTDLADVNQTYQANTWYRLEVDWGASGAITGKLFASNGTTLLQTVSASTTAITSGGIAFRATGHDKYWDTVTAQYGVNSNLARAPAVSSSGSSTASSSGATGAPQVPSRPTFPFVGSFPGLSSMDQYFSALQADELSSSLPAGFGLLPEWELLFERIL